MTEAAALDDVAVFLTVAECSSFIGAARRLGMPQSSVSRRVAALEKRVGTSLFRRTTRSLSLTLEGQALVKKCASPVAQVRAALEELATASSGARGSLSIAVSPYICPEQFRAWVSAFGSENPDLQINLRVNGGEPDFVADGIDLAIQMGPPRQQSLVSVKLYDVPFRLVAADNLLRHKPELGRLTDPSQLLAHPCGVILPITDWCFVSPKGEVRQVAPTNLVATSNDPGIVVDALVQGRGVGLLPEAVADDRLTALDIVGWKPVASSVHAVFPQRLRNTQKIKAALESVRRRGSSNKVRGPRAISSSPPEVALVD